MARGRVWMDACGCRSGARPARECADPFDGGRPAAALAGLLPSSRGALKAISMRCPLSLAPPTAEGVVAPIRRFANSAARGQSQMGRRFRQEAPERRWLVMNTRWWYQTIIYNYMEPLKPQHLSLGSGADLAHVTTVSVRHCGRQEAPERRWLGMNTRWWYQTIIYNYMEPLEPQHLSLGSGADLAHVTTVSVRHCGRQEAPERRWLGMNTRWWYQTIIYTWNPSNPRPVFDLPPASPSSRSLAPPLLPTTTSVALNPKTGLDRRSTRCR